MSVRSIGKAVAGEDGKPAPALENGQPAADEHIRKGEVKYTKYYELPELVVNPQVGAHEPQ
jgi:hypothetical protein